MIRHKGILAGATASLAPPRAASAFSVANAAICAAALDKVAAVIFKLGVEELQGAAELGAEAGLAEVEAFEDGR